jgi:DNA repair exonuclease SbcCD ATPase subunit
MSSELNRKINANINTLCQELTELKQRRTYLNSAQIRARSESEYSKDIDFMKKQTEKINTQLKDINDKLAKVEDELDAFRNAGHPQHAQKIREIQNEIEESNNSQKTEFQKKKEERDRINKARQLKNQLQKEKDAEQKRKNEENAKARAEAYRGRGRGRGRGGGYRGGNNRY